MGSASSPAPVAVLGSRELLSHVTSFLPGLPTLVADFLIANDSLWRAPSRRGMAPRLAIRTRDRRVLAALLRLAERGDCERDERASFHGAKQEAAACGDLDTLQWLMRQRLLASFDDADLLEIAIAHGHTRLSIWLHANHPAACVKLSQEAVDSAAQSSRRELFEWLLESSVASFSPHAMATAIGTGSLAIVRALHKRFGFRCSDERALVVAMSGHYDVLRFVVENRVLADTNAAIHLACSRDRLPVARDMLHWAIDASTVSEREAVACAAMVGDLAVLQRLITVVDRTMLEQAIASSVHFGHLSVVKYLCSQSRSVATTKLLNEAVHRGHEPIVRYFIQDFGLPCSDVALNLAAVHGYSDLVRFLSRGTTAGCLFHARRLAARSQQSEVVAFLTDLIDPFLRAATAHAVSASPLRTQEQAARSGQSSLLAAVASPGCATRRCHDHRRRETRVSRFRPVPHSVGCWESTAIA